MIAITLLITDHLQRITHTHVIPPPKRNSTVCRKEIIKSPDQVTWCYSSTVQWPSSAVQLWWSNLCGGINDICWSKAIKHQEMQYKLYKVDFSIAMLFDEVFPFVERSTPLVTYPLSNFGISCGCVANICPVFPYSWHIQGSVTQVKTTKVYTSGMKSLNILGSIIVLQSSLNLARIAATATVTFNL